MQYECNVYIPKYSAEWFRQVIIHHWFDGDDPVVTRHADAGTRATYTVETRTDMTMAFILAVVFNMGGGRI